MSREQIRELDDATLVHEDLRVKLTITNQYGGLTMKQIKTTKKTHLAAVQASKTIDEKIDTMRAAIADFVEPYGVNTDRAMLYIGYLRGLATTREETPNPLEDCGTDPAEYWARKDEYAAALKRPARKMGRKFDG
jgi:hypothetical protein